MERPSRVPADQAGAGEDAEMGGQGVVRAADRLRDRAGGKPIRLAPHQQPEDREPRGLTERGQRRERMRGGNSVAARRRTDVTDHR